MPYDPMRYAAPTFDEWKAAQEAKRNRWPEMPDSCPHGKRVRKIMRTGGRWSAYLACPLGKSGCGVVHVGLNRVFQEWAAERGSAGTQEHVPATAAGGQPGVEVDDT